MGSDIFIVKWHAIFYCPIYFIRNGLYKSIRDLAPMLSGSVLDFGCGSKPYKQLFVNASSYTGVDVEVSGNKHSNKNVDFYYNGKRLPFPDESFDHIFSSEVFEHVFNLEQMIPELHRVIKKGGYMLITCPFVGPEHEKPFDYARYTSFGIKHLLEKNGFAMKKQIKSGNFVETILQMIALYVYYFLPKKPLLLYYLLHQLFILPIFIFVMITNNFFPKRLRRSDLYTSNIVLVQKQLR